MASDLSASRDRQAAGLICIGFQGWTISDEAAELLRRGVRSIILFTRNFESPAQLTELCAEARRIAGQDLLIAVDQEGGRVQRFQDGFTPIPSMRDLARSRDPSRIREWGHRIGTELRQSGVNWNLAPVMDVDSNPLNPVIGARAFASDPQRVSIFGSAMIEGLQAAGVAACAKHFPGHGDTSLDSHHDLPHVLHDLNRLDNLELIPFRAAIHAGVASIMVAHLAMDELAPGIPSSMSQTVVSGLLRDRLGWTGLVTTDDVEMKAVADRYPIEEVAVQTITAGGDLCMICHSTDLQHRAIDALERAMIEGVVSEHRVHDSIRRIDAVATRFRLAKA